MKPDNNLSQIQDANCLSIFIVKESVLNHLWHYECILRQSTIEFILLLVMFYLHLFFGSPGNVS
jgi:hypothetical protein